MLFGMKKLASELQYKKAWQLKPTKQRKGFNMATITLFWFVIVAFIVALTIGAAMVRNAIVASHGNYFVTCTNDKALANWAHRRVAYLVQRAIIKAMA